MLRTEKRMRLCVTLLILNLTFIWGNSLVPGAVSGAFSDWVKGILSAILPLAGQGDAGGFWVRKLAHFSEFAALGACLGWLFAMQNKGRVFPFLWGAAAACVDETIQCFVPDRGPGIRDVCIDSGGVLFGLLVLHLLHFLYKRHHLEET